MRRWLRKQPLLDVPPPQVTEFLAGDYGRIEVVVHNIGWGMAREITLGVSGQFEADRTRANKAFGLESGLSKHQTLWVAPKRSGKQLPLHLQITYLDARGRAMPSLEVSHEVSVRDKDERRGDSTPIIVQEGGKIIQMRDGDFIEGDQVKIQRQGAGTLPREVPAESVPEPDAGAAADLHLLRHRAAGEPAQMPERQMRHALHPVRKLRLLSAGAREVLHALPGGAIVDRRRLTCSPPVRRPVEAAGGRETADKLENVNGCFDMDDMTLGKYRILAEIGKGGFATVYRALDTTLDREVALKVLDPLLARDPAWVARFQREAKAIARLKHPHIVTIHEIGESEGRLYIAMELIDGPSLAAAHRRARPAAVGRNAGDPEAGGGCAGLRARPGGAAPRPEAGEHPARSHARGDPDRLRLRPAGGRVLDERVAERRGGGHARLHRAGGVGRRGADRQTDLYSLGCVAYEMLTGEVLFAGKTPSVVIKKHTVDGPSVAGCCALAGRRAGGGARCPGACPGERPGPTICRRRRAAGCAFDLKLTGVGDRRYAARRTFVQ